MIQFTMVLELNRDDMNDKLDSIKMKLRDVINLYFIKLKNILIKYKYKKLPETIMLKGYYTLKMR